MSKKIYLFLFIALLGLQGLAQADVVITTVFNIVESKRTERLLVLSGMDGRVYTYPKSSKDLKYLKSLVGSIVKLTYTERGHEALITNISSVNPREINADELDLNKFQYNQLRQFAPSELQSDAHVKTIFDGMLNDGDKARSQCFKRAHMWSYDMWSKLGIYSQKVFIFYTQRYQMLEDTKWWFHVAPMVISQGVEYVLDGTFFNKPITLKEWQQYFIQSKKITCPVIDNIQTYEKGHYKRLCYLMKVPMYHFSPLDIEQRDTKGIERNHWVIEELQDARRAFRDYDKTYEALDTGKPTIKY